MKKKLSCAIILSGIIGILSTAALAQSSSVHIIRLDNKEEYVLIKNEGETSINLKGWILHDHDYGKGSLYSYTFSEFILSPGDVLQMQSGKGKKAGDDDEKTYKIDEATLYLRWSDRDVWNNACDIAYLLDSQGKLIVEKQEGKDLETGKKEHCK